MAAMDEPAAAAPGTAAGPETAAAVGEPGAGVETAAALGEPAAARAAAVRGCGGDFGGGGGCSW
jgi:hypothetical protein